MGTLIKGSKAFMTTDEEILPMHKGIYTPNNTDKALLDAAVKCGLYQALVTSDTPHWVQFVGPINGSLFQSEEAKDRQMIVYSLKEWRFV